MKIFSILLIPLSLIALTAYCYHLNLQFKGWLTFGTIIICYGSINAYGNVIIQTYNKQTKK